MTAAVDLCAQVGVKRACEALGIARASFYRRADGSPPAGEVPRPAPPLALDARERAEVRDVLHSERFCDDSPHQVYAKLLDEGRYLCSVRTMYRILAREHGEVGERRRHVRRPLYAKPELLATGPNQVWSRDITKPKSAVKWTCFYLYVILDIFSRYVVGWMVADREQDALARRLMDETCRKQNIEPGTLTLHSDRGPSMRSKSVAFLLADPGVCKTHGRPHVSNDNPYSESQFKTLKYCPRFPEFFGSLWDCRSFCRGFVEWYNREHRHSGVAYLTAEQVHYGLAGRVLEIRSETLLSAFIGNPRRFKGVLPRPWPLPDAVWINKPDFPDGDERRRGAAGTESLKNGVEAAPRRSGFGAVAEPVEGSLILDTNFL